MVQYSTPSGAYPDCLAVLSGGRFLRELSPTTRSRLRGAGHHPDPPAATRRRSGCLRRACLGPVRYRKLPSPADRKVSASAMLPSRLEKRGRSQEAHMADLVRRGSGARRDHPALVPRETICWEAPRATQHLAALGAGAASRGTLALAHADDHRPGDPVVEPSRWTRAVWRGAGEGSDPQRAAGCRNGWSGSPNLYDCCLTGATA